MRRLRIGLIFLSWCLAGPAPGMARAEPAWAAWQGQGADGLPSGRLAFGTVATDTIVLDVACHASNPAQSEYALYLDLAQHREGDQVDVLFTTRRDQERRSATVVEDAFGLHVAGVLPRDDVLWQILSDASEAQVNVTDGTVATLPLAGSKAVIARYLAICAALPAAPAATAAAAPAAPAETPTEDGAAAPPTGPAATGATPADDDATEPTAAPADSPALASLTASPDAATAEGPTALPGPLYSTGAGPVPAFSSFRYGIVLTPIPPGTELMGTTRTAHDEDKDWVEVSTRRGAGPVVWVLRPLLTPISGGAAAYRNLNSAANLLMRANPAPDAPVVGTIPGGADGILDRGQRQGDWVLVAFRGVTGWAAHDYLLPILPPLPPDADQQGPSAPLGNQTPFALTYGTWQAACDPCRDPADGPPCRLSTRSVATQRQPSDLRIDVTGTAAQPRLEWRYTAGPDLPAPEAEAAVLTLAVDDDLPHAIARTNWRVERGTGTVVMPGGAFGSLMPRLQGGVSLVLSVSEPARSWDDAFELFGFANALAATTARLPVVSEFDGDRCTANRQAAAAPPAPDPDRQGSEQPAADASGAPASSN
ncbi:MAG: hypothetical protein R3F55_13875 [Alphaproteobacteria bacterium]